MNKLQSHLIALAIAALLSNGSALVWPVAKADPADREASAQTAASPGPTATPKAAPPPAGVAASRRPVYKPPQRGAPEVRVNAGSRGTGDGLPAIHVLAPNHAGLTTQSQPTLFWYLSKATRSKIEVSLFLENDPRPLLELKLEGTDHSGLQKLPLSKHGVSLKPNLAYQWVVALVPDAKNRSKDSLASGIVKRIDPAPSLKDKIAAAKAEERAMIYAEQGVWFDAIESLLDRMETDPKDSETVDQIMALLEQVGLKEVKIKP